MSRPAIALLIVLLMLSSWPLLPGAAESAPAADSTVDWPVVTPVSGGELRLYHPQVETFEGNRITARAAFSITAGGQSQPTFGVVWLAARATTDREERTITLSDQAATKVHLPGASDQEEAGIGTAVTGLVKGLDPVLSLDRILAALSESQRGRQSAEGLSTAPPKIIVVERRAVLLLVDGEPVAAPLTGSRFERIENTPFLVARDPANGACWLLYGKRWYSAPAIGGPWTVQTRISDEVMALAPLLQGFAADEGEEAPGGAPVDIVVSQVPAELISSDGPPAYEPIPGTELLAVTNSDNDLFLDTANQQHYVLLAGRWFRTGVLARGSWELVAAGALPPGFSHIPPDSKYGTVLAHVPGTAAAEEAALDAQVPQTAAVKRDATVTATYDGEPQWQPIANTSLSYAVNSPLAVLKVADNDYYCCSEGVWYRAPSANGPWTVAASVPPEVARIPPDNPLYPVRYVYVYDTTPEYVYVGYSPGYLGCFVFNGCVVWGTGYHYHAWYGHRYFPRPATWGFGMAYNPWTGHWGGGVHLAIGGRFGGFGVAATHDGWWGPAGYRPVIITRQVDHRQRPGSGPQRADAHEWSNQSLGDNLYRRPGNRERVLPATISRTPVRPAEPRRQGVPGREPERILPGRDGEVFRRSGEGWQQWQHDGWKPMPADGARPPTAPPANDGRPTVPPPHNDARPPSPGEVHPQPPRTPPANDGRPPAPANDAPVRPPPVNDGRLPPHADAPRPPPVNDGRLPPHADAPRPPPVNEGRLPPHTDAPRPPPVNDGRLPPHTDAPHPAPSAPSRAEQLERQQHFEDRGNQRTQQFQQYRANPPDALRHGDGGPAH